MQEMEFI